MPRTILRILIPGLAVLLILMVALPRRITPPPEAATELPSPLMLPATTFITNRETVFTTADLSGTFSLVFFGFTNCPDICPLSMQVLAQARRQLVADDPDVVPEIYLVSVDPARDTPARLTEYLSAFDPGMTGLTAPETDLAPLLATLGVVVMRQDMPGGSYNMTHNPQVFVTGPDSAVIAIISSATDPALVVSDYLRIRRRYLAAMPGTAAAG